MNQVTETADLSSANAAAAHYHADKTIYKTRNTDSLLFDLTA